MKCVKCGAELKEGCLYCSVCGHESQIVPDYSVLEDEYLRTLLKEEVEVPVKEQPANSNKPKEKKPVPKKKKKNNMIPLLIVGCILIVGIIIGVVIKVSIDQKNANSYEYQVEMAQKELVDLNYEKALNYYKTALSIQPGDVAVRMAMSDIYLDLKETDSAMVLLLEVVEADKNNKEAYQKLIQIYEGKKDYDSIVELASGVSDEKILDLFEGYLVGEPVASQEAGRYEEPVEITLFSVDEDEIYYTIDGTTPDAENGILYREEDKILFDENGVYELQAVCRNDKGIYSQILAETYTVELAAPAYPTVTPDGGRMNEETTVTITADENCSIYYTWDGTDPTTESTRYETPLEIPEGNNILSILVVDDRTELDSGVYRANFIYYP